LGELQQIDPELFESALQQLLRQKGELLRHAQIELEVEPASFRCRVCRREWGFDEARLAPEEAEFVHFVPEVAHVYMRCPGCGSPDFEVIRGRDLWLASLRGVR
jgi:hydrogenase nickel incorporation protein HypA/HybF